MACERVKKGSRDHDAFTYSTAQSDGDGYDACH